MGKLRHKLLFGLLRLGLTHARRLQLLAHQVEPFDQISEGIVLPNWKRNVQIAFRNLAREAAHFPRWTQKEPVDGHEKQKPPDEHHSPEDQERAAEGISRPLKIPPDIVPNHLADDFALRRKIHHQPILRIRPHHLGLRLAGEHEFATELLLNRLPRLPLEVCLPDAVKFIIVCHHIPLGRGFPAGGEPQPRQRPEHDQDIDNHDSVSVFHIKSPNILPMPRAAFAGPILRA